MPQITYNSVNYDMQIADGTATISKPDGVMPDESEHEGIINQAKSYCVGNGFNKANGGEVTSYQFEGTEPEPVTSPPEDDGVQHGVLVVGKDENGNPTSRSIPADTAAEAQALVDVGNSTPEAQDAIAKMVSGEAPAADEPATEISYRTELHAKPEPATGGAEFGIDPADTTTESVDRDAGLGDRDGQPF